MVAISQGPSDSRTPRRRPPPAARRLHGPGGPRRALRAGLPRIDRGRSARRAPRPAAASSQSPRRRRGRQDDALPLDAEPALAREASPLAHGPCHARPAAGCGSSRAPPGRPPPTSHGVRHERERQAPTPPIRCAPGTGISGPAGSSRYGLAFRLISPNDRSTVSASSRPSSTSSYSVIVVEQHADPRGLDEAVGRVGRQRHLAVAALHVRPRSTTANWPSAAESWRARAAGRAIGGGGRATGSRTRRDADERLAGPQLDPRRHLGRHRRRRSGRARRLHARPASRSVAGPTARRAAARPRSPTSTDGERRVDDQIVAGGP